MLRIFPANEREVRGSMGPSSFVRPFVRKTPGYKAVSSGGFERAQKYVIVLTFRSYFALRDQTSRSCLLFREFRKILLLSAALEIPGSQTGIFWLNGKTPGLKTKLVFVSSL